MRLSRSRLWPPGQSRFRVLGWIGVVGLVLTALLVPASPALSNDTPGNNGTVKIHEGAGENDPGEVRNEPHVCTFHLHFYFSDPEQAGTWEIQEWSPGDKGTVALTGTYDTQGDGEDRQPPEGVYSLPNGHYKLFWDGDLDTVKHDKMKVFWVDCPTPTQSVGAETETPTEVPPTEAPPTEAPPTEAPPTEQPPTEQPPTEVPPSEIPPTEQPPTEVPPTEVPPTEVATPTFEQSQGGETSTPSFEQSQGGETNVPGTLPNTSMDSTTGPDDTGWRGLMIALAFLIALVLVVDPSRPLGRERRR